MPDTNNISLIIDLCGNNIKKLCSNIVNTHLPKNVLFQSPLAALTIIVFLLPLDSLGIFELFKLVLRDKSIFYI